MDKKLLSQVMSELGKKSIRSRFKNKSKKEISILMGKVSRARNKDKMKLPTSDLSNGLTSL